MPYTFALPFTGLNARNPVRWYTNGPHQLAKKMAPLTLTPINPPSKPHFKPKRRRPQPYSFHLGLNRQQGPTTPKVAGPT
ncbi:hypothetical protein L0F63_005532, partial [Massospora cicadina]